MALKIEQNPALTFPADVLDTYDRSKTWYVAQTKSRREKALANFLAKRDVGYFLPLYGKRQPSSRRARYSLVPLFPGYLFFKGTEAQRLEAYTSNHIARLIDVEDQDTLVRELGLTRDLLSLDAPVYPFELVREGQRVRITHGPMRGIEGVISSKKKNYRLVLNVTSIAQAVAVDVAADMVEASA